MSKNYCCVPGCVESGESHPVLHVFPNPNKHIDRFRSWVHAVGGDIVGLANDAIYKNRRVCHRHFKEEHCCRYNKLSQLAVPRMYLPGLSTIPRFTLSAHRPMRSIQNIEEEEKHNMPSTSIEYNEHLFGMGPITRHVQQSSADPNDNENKENCSPSVESVVIPDIQDCQTVQDLVKKSVNISDSIKKTKTASAHVPLIKKGSRLTQSEHKLYMKLLQVRNKLSKLRNKSKRQSANIKAARKLTSNASFVATLESFTSSAKILTMMQFREHKKKNKGRRFSLEEKILALSIFKHTPKGYRYLRKIYVLPAPQTLTKLISEANLKPGINKNIFTQLKKMTEKMKVEDRLCVLLFDEMYLKANICYNERRDRVSGFVSNGKETKAEFADHAQVFMARGLIKNYKQPVSYTFSAASTKGQELAVQIKTVVTELQEAGLIIVSTICDQGANNRLAIKLLIQETHASYIRKGQEPNDRIIIINKQEIIPLYDPPHLLKCIRNNLLTKNLEYSQENIKKTAKWEHIRLLHNENPGYKGIRLIPKLTDNHVIPQKISKMKVKYASQIFSRTVASNMGFLADKGILPMKCRETADIILFFDNLFDSCNGSYCKKNKIHGKPLLGPVTPSSIHHKVWSEGKKMLKEMKFVHPETGKVENVPTLCNWAWTLEGFEILLKKINYDFRISSVWMRHLNQDPIENFFGAIRSHGCRDTNPTTDKFEGAFTTLLINNISSVHAPGNNCENDLCQNLNTLLITKDNGCQAATTLDIMPDIHITSFSEKKDPRILGAIQYVTGYFIRNSKRKIFKSCELCKKDFIALQGAEYIKYREYAGRQWLCSPTESVIECISNVQEISNFVLKNFVYKENIKELIKTYIFMFVSFDFVNCIEHKDSVVDYLINSSTRFFIFNYCKEINRILCGRRENYDEEDVMQAKAKKYYKKCFKRPNK